jgi:tRNA G10  N-methylase Trm11
MLPPKLARIMINMIHVSREETGVRLLDPFCGSGTVLSEALRMGFTDLVGSDKNPEAVAATQKNLAWIAERWPEAMPKDAKQEVFVSDAREVSGKLGSKTVDAVVAELYLGKPLRGGEKRGELQRELGELQKMYREALANWRHCLKPGAPLVLAFPVYVYGPERHGISTKEFETLGFRPEALLPAPLLSRLGARETKNHGLMYGRNDQRVWREIVRLRYEG